MNSYSVVDIRDAMEKNTAVNPALIASGENNLRSNEDSGMLSVSKDGFSSNSRQASR